jgi:hypothetical protein
MTPSGVRGVLNDAVSTYFIAAASAFVARWCAGFIVETKDGVFRIRDDEPADAAIASVGTQEPMVRRLFPGGNRIRTIGPAVEERPFRRPTSVSAPTARIGDNPRDGPMVPFLRRRVRISRSRLAVRASAPPRTQHPAAVNAGELMLAWPP